MKTNTKTNSKFDYKQIISFKKAYNAASDELKKEYDNSVTTDSPVDVVAFAQLKLIFSVINEGFVPDYTNWNQEKWYGVFDLSSGCRFSDTYYYYTITHTCVGSRLCTENEERYLHIATHFINEFERYLTGK